MQVGSTFDTTSTPNYLGTTGDDAFLSGDQFTMMFLAGGAGGGDCSSSAAASTWQETMA